MASAGRSGARGRSAASPVRAWFPVSLRVLPRALPPAWPRALESAARFCSEYGRRSAFGEVFIPPSAAGAAAARRAPARRDSSGRDSMSRVTRARADLRRRGLLGRAHAQLLADADFRRIVQRCSSAPARGSRRRAPARSNTACRRASPRRGPGARGRLRAPAPPAASPARRAAGRRSSTGAGVRDAQPGWTSSDQQHHQHCDGKLHHAFPGWSGTKRTGSSAVSV